MSYNIPILLIIFNREESAMKVLESIRNVRPSKIYIASDGARESRKGEREIVESIRKKIISNIDWNCQTNTLFQESNLGCKNGVNTAINWFFENEDFGIILEDDCIASPSFFKYVQEMLFKYKDDSRIGMVAGHNPFKIKAYPYSIIFSRFKACWGWATWKRAWKNMDLNMEWRDTIFKDSIINNSGYKALDKDKWLFELKCLDNEYVSTWDWQWYFSLSAQNQLCIFPVVNLISNIGNDKEATHTSFSSVTIPYGELKFPLSLPPYLCPCESFDKEFYKSDHSLKSYLIRIIPPSIKKRLKKLLKS